jgi:hypothetical protein
VIKSVVWMGLGQRANAFVGFYENAARELEVEFPEGYRFFTRSDDVRKYIQFPATISARHVFLFFPLFFAIVYLIIALATFAR